MKLAVINGSPRNKKSNSKILIDNFLSGYGSVCSDNVPVHYLAGSKTKGEEENIFLNADIVFVFFPLYTDCMPGIVKEFFETISELKYTGDKKIGFVVQSGFPEAIHSIYVERYLEKLTKRLKCEYLGTIIKGGVEGIQAMPPWMTKKLFSNFRELGVYFANNNTFSPDIKNSLQKFYKMSAGKQLLYSLLSKTGLANFYWNSELKKNGVFQKRFDMPLAAEINCN